MINLLRAAVSRNVTCSNGPTTGTHLVGPFQKKWDLGHLLGPSRLSPKSTGIYDSATATPKGPTHRGTFATCPRQTETPSPSPKNRPQAESHSGPVEQTGLRANDHAHRKPAPG